MYQYYLEVIYRPDGKKASISDVEQALTINPIQEAQVRQGYKYPEVLCGARAHAITVRDHLHAQGFDCIGLQSEAGPIGPADEITLPEILSRVPALALYLQQAENAALPQHNYENAQTFYSMAKGEIQHVVGQFATDPLLNSQHAYQLVMDELERICAVLEVKGIL